MASTDEPNSAGLYFAFGSNMHLRQMAKRCPRSTLDSKGRLYNYRWQINYRGVANIVRGNPEDFVEGLLFVVTPRDVATLDRNEGVSKGFYKRVFLQIKREPLSVELPPRAKARITAAAGWLEEYTRYKARSRLPLPPESTAPTRRSEEEPGEPHSSEPDFVEALVYISDETREGQIRLEYVARMRSAMFDAQELGVSENYLDTYLDPLVSARDEEIALAEQEAAEQEAADQEAAEQAAAEQAAVEHGESRSDRHLVPAGQIGGHRDEESRRREHRHVSDEVNDTAREHRRGHRHHSHNPQINPRDFQIAPRHREAQRRTRGPDINLGHNHPRDSQIAPRHREVQRRARGPDIYLGDDRGSSRALYYESEEVDNSWARWREWIIRSTGL
ncbi:hypothetical protein F4818DRAFT_395427 [Hypoxylon cercidicola]|nr:hypothetical protein F4818DRAFT_395427 [Hypoxylon cercidicola]